MKKSILKALAIGISSGLFLTGCGSQFPEMTEEEYNQVVQYSVNLLLKYSNNGVERLSSLSALEMQKQIEKENREAAKAARDAEAAAKLANGEIGGEEEGSEETTDLAMTEETADTPTEQEEEVTEEPSTDKEDDATKAPEDEEKDTSSDEQKPEDASDTGKSEDDDIDKLLEKYEDELQEGIDNASAETSDETGDDASTEDSQPQEQPEETEIPVSDNPSEEEILKTETDTVVDGMRQEISKGIFLTYSGYSVNSSYADESEVFSITATSGNKLLVLNFKLINTSGMDVTVDMVKANPHFQIILNGKNVGYTNVTMLQNDLSSFAGTIPADAKVNMVLVKQMNADKVKTVDSLGLIGDLKGETITFNLE